MALPTAADLAGVAALPDLLAFLQVAALNRWAVNQAVANVQLPGGAPISVVQAAQLGLVWRSCRKALFLKGGGAEADFEDIDPWEQQSGSASKPATFTGTNSVKEGVLKMASLVDQTDESELLPPRADEVQAWMQRYVLLMGSPPEEEEEPTEAQLAGLHKRVETLKQAPYVDFGVWLPFGRRALKTQKFRVYMPLGDGTYFMRELPGPQNFQQWMASWRVFKVAALMLGFCSLAALSAYEKTIERLVIQWPNAWGLICYAEDKARAERLEKRKQFVTDKKLGNAVRADFQEDDPWSCVLRALAQDGKFWAEQVVNPAVVRRGKGSPVAAAEMIAGAHLPGVLHAPPAPHPGHDEGLDRKRQANRDKRAAKRKRLQNERAELNRLRGGHRPEEIKNETKKGGGKGKSKDQAGNQLCYSWCSGNGACADVPPEKRECKCKVKRAHKCQICLSPAHRNADCPSR